VVWELTIGFTGIQEVSGTGAGGIFRVHIDAMWMSLSIGSSFLFNPYARTFSFYFILQIDNNLPDILIGDRARVGQILHNYLCNAIKFTHSVIPYHSLSLCIASLLFNLTNSWYDHIQGYIRLEVMAGLKHGVYIDNGRYLLQFDGMGMSVLAHRIDALALHYNFEWPHLRADCIACTVVKCTTQASVFRQNRKTSCSIASHNSKLGKLVDRVVEPVRLCVQHIAFMSSKSRCS